MINYEIRKTDINEPIITVPQETVIRDAVDLPLIGQFKTDYGTDVNQSLVNLLENFACPEASGAASEDEASPDLTRTSDGQLSNPVVGQMWYNSTRQLIYYWTGTAWVLTPIRNQYAANWGRTLHGQSLPKPVSRDGRVFEYSECIWSVSPAVFSAAIDTFNCNTDRNAKVTVQQRYTGREAIMDSIANYLIIGIDNNINQGGWAIDTPIMVSPTPSPTASVTPTVTSTVTPSVTTSITPSVTAEPTPTMTPTGTSAVTPSTTPPVTPPVTPPITPSVTPSPSNVIVTYCWSIGQLCLGFTDPDGGYHNLWKDSVSGQPAAGVCTVADNNSAYGLIYWTTPVRFNKLAALVPVTLVGSNGASSTQTLLFTTTLSPSENLIQETVTRYISINGENREVQARMTWNKRGGNNNAANGTLTVQLLFPDTRGRC